MDMEDALELQEEIKELKDELRYSEHDLEETKDREEELLDDVRDLEIERDSLDEELIELKKSISEYSQFMSVLDYTNIDFSTMHNKSTLEALLENWDSINYEYIPSRITIDLP